MPTSDRELVAHLSRRAGFGANPDELDTYVDMSYEDLVEDFLDTEGANHIPDDLIYLNCAYMSPSLKSVTEAGLKGVSRKKSPWKIEAENFFDEAEIAAAPCPQIKHMLNVMPID